MKKVTEMDRYLFGEGTHYEIYEKLGAHLDNRGRSKGCRFALWAPNAKAVWVIGSFNDWNGTKNQMELLPSGGIYECFIPEVKEGDLYKYRIEGRDGIFYDKADPYGNQSQLRPGNASVVSNIQELAWTDSKWINSNKEMDVYERPLSILEVHPGSFMRHLWEEGDGFYSYRELAVVLTDYVHKMGYTHVELMGICEYPYDGSWGYQVTGYYAPTSRYGNPRDFAYFVNYLHKHHVGVILDWVPAHFPKDPHGLAWFDGAPLYEYADPRKGEHSEWGTKVFDYGKNEVKNFLIANALFWIEKFHIDGIRVDAVASMLYLDYGRQAGEWVPNIYGENKNLEAIQLFQQLNTVIKERDPHAMVIAEESTAWSKVTGSPKEGGLGFTYKWNMGWMHDFVEYITQDPLYRKYHHHKMTFGLVYNTTEKFVLVLSHDEVVHLKCSMLNKMPGSLDDKFENLKVAYAFMLGHPGKKLLFMGQDFGQEREWCEDRELDWFLLEDPRHKSLQEFTAKLFQLYRKYPALYSHDHDEEGFEWINANDAERSIFSFIRKSPTRRNNFLFVMNFTPVERLDYRVGVPKNKKYTMVVSTDRGSIQKPEGTEIYSEVGECDGREYSIGFKLGSYGVAILKY